MDELEIQKYQNLKIRKNIKIIGFIVSLIIILISIISLLFYGFYREKLTEEIFIYGEMALFFGVVFLEFIPQILSSHLPLAVSILSGMGILKSVIIAISASLLSSVLAFEIGKKFGWKFTCSLAKPKKLIKIVNFWNKYGKSYVLLSAISPLPYFPLVYGSLGMTRKNMWFFGIIPRIISFVFVGYLVSLGKF